MFTATKDETVHSLKNSAQNLRENASETANAVGDDIRDAANKAGRKVRNFVDTASDELSHVSDTVTTQIRSRPVQASLIALGAGFVIGMLMRR